MLSKSVFIDNKNILFNYDERLSEAADWLIAYMVTEFPNSGKLDDGYSIDIGWSVLLLKSDDKGDLVLCEPDFSKNPFENIVGSINSTLLIQSQQLTLSKRLNETPLGTSFQDLIMIRKGCFDFYELYMTRSEPNIEKRDSGWYISTRALEYNEENLPIPGYETIYAFELIQYRPALLEALSLPVGYFVTSSNDQLESIFNSENQEVYSKNQ